MPHFFDATNKHLFHPHPADWIALGGLPLGTSLELVDCDLSAITAAADKLVRVNGPRPYGAHIEFQASFDAMLDGRMLVYNVLYRHRSGLDVRTVVFLLRPEALGTGVTGRVLADSIPGHRLDFEYKLIRVWEIPVDVLLTGGLGTLPLAPVAAVKEPELPGVIESMKRRLDSEVRPEEARELWTATRILMGLRWPPNLVGQLLKGVQGMKESATYQEIVREGLEEGRTQGIKEGIKEGIKQGRVAEAQSLLLRRGVKLLGSPDAAAQARLKAIDNPSELEALLDRALDGTASTWNDLLR